MSLYSYKYQFVFIHIPKNAGSTFENNYSAHLPAGELLHFELLNQLLGYERDAALGNHFTFSMIEDIVANHNVPFDLEAAFKFCVVRNPWERMVSLYEHRLRKIDRLTNGVPRNTPEDKALLLRGFEPWLLHTQNVSDVVLVRKPQLDWIRNKEGKQVCELIIPIEEYDDGIQKAIEHVGLPRIDMPRRNTSSKDSSKYKSYFGPEGRKHIEKYFAEDIDTFGFKF